MEKFNFEQHRNKVAEDLKNIRKTQDNRTSEEKASALATDTDPRKAMQDYLDKAKKTPEYKFSQFKHKDAKLLKGIDEVAEQYFSSIVGADNKIIEDKVNGESKKPAIFNKSLKSREVLIEKLKNLEKIEVFNTDHIDISLRKDGKENKHVLVEVIQLNENDPRVLLSKKFLEEFPEYKVLIEGESEKEMGRVNITDIQGIKIDQEKVKNFLTEQLNDIDISQISEVKKESFVLARPTATHSLHRIIAGSFTQKQLIPDAARREYLEGYASKQENVLVQINQAIQSKNNFQLIRSLVELAIRDKQWGQDNAPIFVVNGGGFMKVLEDGTIEIYGESGGFKKEERERTLEILQRELPDQKFIVRE